ncbi:MAG TPA: CoA ester lyase [Thermomicrobiales bacterium]|jgi:citrate lyase subunit beta/citryl-CoA lyase|nr:CoA ester lyase [Thermomicrobiales bacterium]
MSQSDAMIQPIRSELSVPGGDLRKVQKALASDADAVFLDLEDSVAPGQKDAARQVVIDMLTSLEWGLLEPAVRINGISTPWCYWDLIQIVEQAGSHLAKVVVPKVRSAGDIHFVDRLLNQLEQRIGRTDPIRIEAQIEDAAGLMSIREIATASERISELTFGQGDFAASVGMPAADIGVADEWDNVVEGDRWLLARQTIVFAARAAGIRALNGPYAAYQSGEEFRGYCLMSRALGFDGVWCIHPNQIAIANEVFSPSEQEITRARATIEAMEDAWTSGQGAASRDSVMIDEASLRMARSVLATAELIEQRQTKTDGA